MATVKPYPAKANSLYKDYTGPITYYYKRKVIDFVECTALKGSALAQNDVIEAIPLEAGEILVGGFAKIITAGTASTTATIGITDDDPDGLIKSVALDGTAGTVTAANGAYIFTQATTDDKPVTWVGGKAIATDDTLDLLLDHSTAVKAGVVEVIAIFASYNR